MKVSGIDFLVGTSLSGDELKLTVIIKLKRAGNMNFSGQFFRHAYRQSNRASFSRFAAQQ
jgi:hypothetical protein